MKVDERARAGLFLAMQYPVEVAGCLGLELPAHRRNRDSWRVAEDPHLGRRGQDGAMTKLQIDAAFAERNVNEGFSGGEKKRHEILQLELLNPKFAILDETDSGLDVDALRVVSEGVNRFRAQADRGVLLITHYTRILRYIEPDFVHVFVDGRIVEEGGRELADRLEAEGYERYAKTAMRRQNRRDLDDRDSPLDVELPPQGLPDLERRVHDDVPLVYLDSANTSQKPQQVIDVLIGILRAAQLQHSPGHPCVGRRSH